MIRLLLMMIRDDGWSGFSVTVNVQCLKIMYTSANNKTFIYV